MPQELQRRPFGPWTLFFLIWNGVGALLIVYFDMYAILAFRCAIEPPNQILCSIFFWAWFPSLPFTTLGVAIALWQGRRSVASRLLLVYTGTVLVLWGGLILMIFAFFGGLDV